MLANYSRQYKCYSRVWVMKSTMLDIINHHPGKKSDRGQDNDQQRYKQGWVLNLIQNIQEISGMSQKDSSKIDEIGRKK